MCDVSSSSSSSPFDQALAKPLLLQEEPIRKKWSLFSSSSLSCHDASAASVSSSSSSTGTPDDDQQQQQRQSYEAPDLEDGLLMTSILQEETIELDMAILRERHEEIRDIHTSMSLVHDISKDLAMIVDSQESYVKHLNAMAIEAYDEAEAGWKHIQAIQKGLAGRKASSSSSQQQQRPYSWYGITTATATLLLIMGVYYWEFMMNAAAAAYDDGNGSQSTSSTTTTKTP